jgi:hypothetical protein
MAFRRIGILPTPGYGCNEASACTEGLALKLTYICDREGTNETVTRSIIFDTVVAFCFHDEGHARDWPSEAYDAVAENTDSDWVRQLKVTVPDGPTTWPFTRRHFVVYLRNHGCYEVIAEGCKFDPPSASQEGSEVPPLRSRS